MTAGLAVDIASVADTVTKTVIAVLTLIAVALVVLGLGRAWLGRRRAQVVIQDIEPLDGLPPSVIAGLSPQLRQGVRRALASQSRDAAHAHLKTLAEDMAAGLLVTARGTTVRSVTTELQASTRDSLVALAAGVRALAPDEADGLLGVLGASLPAQLGWVVRVFPALRDSEGLTEVGVSLEFGELGHAPDAVTAFWTSLRSQPAQSGDAEFAAAARSALDDLLEPTSLWIAIQLVARHVAQTGPRAGGRLDRRRRRRRELAGVRRQMAGQMSLYATRQAKFDGGFAEQALEDLAEAARLLPDYFRPRATQAAVHERVGWSYRRRGSAVPARRAFIEAIRAYDRADALILDVAAANASQVCVEAHERIAVRRTKCRLLSEDQAQSATARRELQSWGEPTRPTPLTLYNSACLFAVAMGAGDNEVGDPALYEWRAWHLLGRSLLMGGTDGPWDFALTDVELESLDLALRVRFCNELKVRNAPMEALTDAQTRPLVDEAMRILGVVPRRG